jgi:glycerol-3-phosphate dehydrogenase
LNYVRVERLLKDQGRVCGVVARNMESGREFELRARVVINATGVYTDAIRRLDDASAAPMMAASQGIHLVFERSFLPGDSALMVPKTKDGRILFGIPWHGRTVIGTTDTPVTETPLEPRALPEEIDFLLEHAALYLAKAPSRRDILSTFTGLRPLVKSSPAKNTAKLARDHVLTVSAGGLITITGGKWTTYRKMAEDTINEAIKVGGLKSVSCNTREKRLHGAPPAGDPPSAVWNTHGSEAPELEALSQSDPSLAGLLHPRLPYRAVEVVWAVRHEMARSVEDILSRRTRALLLDARAAGEAAPTVAALMARELGRNTAWEHAQTAEFQKLAANCLPN